MSKLTIPTDLKGKELYKFLIENKSDLINQKKSMLKYTEPFSYNPELFLVGKEGTATKAAIGTPPVLGADTLRVKVVANAANWVDSHMDLLIDDCWKKSVKERKHLIPHLADHEHKVGTNAEIGIVQDIYSTNLSLTELGLNKKGTTQCLIFVTDVKKSYNEIIFNKYKDGRINQHSIGLIYIKMELAINDEEYEKELDFWTKYYDRIINKELVDEKGYFWVISEIQLLENSAVLFGANVLTPTLEVISEDTTIQPGAKSTVTEPTKQVRKSLFGKRTVTT